MINNQLPVACLLTDSELQARRRDILQKTRAAVTEVKELDDGFAYQFSAGESRVIELAQLVELEHQCCPFLTFRITVEPGDGPVWLELTGPEGTKAFLANLFS